MVDSCRTCPSCKRGLEQFCDKSPSLTYNGPDKDTRRRHLRRLLDSIVVDETSCCSIPAKLDLAAAAPLLCAGITTYSPLRHWDVGPARRSASSASADSATWA